MEELQFENNRLRDLLASLKEENRKLIQEWDSIAFVLYIVSRKAISQASITSPATNPPNNGTTVQLRCQWRLVIIPSPMSALIKTNWKPLGGKEKKAPTKKIIEEKSSTKDNTENSEPANESTSLLIDRWSSGDG